MKPRLKDLLGKGYFPEVIPPIFNTISYGKVLSKRRPIEFEYRGRHTFQPTSKRVIYNQARQGSLRRCFSIPNPIHFYRLAKCVYKNWKEIKYLANASPFSLTKPRLSNGNRCFRPETPFKDRPLLRAKVRSFSKFILKADISQFFPSIYTHSIAWAFHSKSECKNNRSDSLLGNLIDKHVRNLQDGQTNGIPIGQDISRLLAEIILSKIDVNLNSNVILTGMRCIDDYEFGFLNRNQADEVLSKLEIELSNFELSLNPHKTGIYNLPQYYIDRWDAEIRDQFNKYISLNLIPFENEISTNDLLILFNKAFKLQKEYPFEGVLRFCFSQLRKLNYSESSWELYQDFMFQSTLTETGIVKHLIINLLIAKYNN